MRFPDTMAPQAFYLNRRVQRSTALCLFLLSCIIFGLYGRNIWPSVGDLRLDTNTGLHTPGAAPDSGKSAEPVPPSGPKDEPLHKDIPEFDPEKMPAIPTSVPPSKPKGVSVPVTLDQTRVALIIETRANPALPAILSSFIATTPLAWIVKVVGSNETFSLIRSSASLVTHLGTGKLALSELPDHYPVHDNELLSQTLTNITFYSEFLKPAEWILLFQTDSIICSASEQSLDDWVAKNYSWVGAPWTAMIPGGNGGLSLRHVPRIIEVLKKETRKVKADWEDVWLCNHLADSAAPASEESAFSVESIYHERPLGYHLRGSGKLVDASIWGNATRKRQILSYCPETKLLLGNMLLEPGGDDELELKEKEADAKVAKDLAKNEPIDLKKVVNEFADSFVPSSDRQAPGLVNIKTNSTFHAGGGK